VSSQRPSRRASLEARRRDSLRTGKTAEVASPAVLAETNKPKCLDWRTFAVVHIGIKNKFGALANLQQSPFDPPEKVLASIYRPTDALGVPSVP
jgi:hypothetical protein